jgi:UDP-N-acetylmuramate dehydrogenase
MLPEIQQNISLKKYNTFGIDVFAEFFTTFSSANQLKELLIDDEVKRKNILVLGGGSNMLFTKNVTGIVLHNIIGGIQISNETNEYADVNVGAGVVWHTFVLWCVERNLGGVENLSLIPGTTGAGPIQNIGAYGVELKEVFLELTAIEIANGRIRKFNHSQCNFGYRNSVFKNELKGKYVITDVTFRLKKNPVFTTSYGAIEQELKKMNVFSLSVKAISDAVISIRKSKLPNPLVLGNAGSFFKNPEVSVDFYIKLKTTYPLVPGYPASDSGVKLAAGWLIEQCGWKGLRKGNTGSHKDQALVLVNYGAATGKEIYSLALEIKQSVFEKFAVAIEPEVNVI